MYGDNINLWIRVINQKRGDKNKIYSLHEPEVECISKGKELTDRGYRGKKEVGGMKVCIPTSGSPGQTYYEKMKERKKFRKRAGIEPVIGHLKSDHRMIRNYLSGTAGDAINTLMAAAAYNLRHWMNKLPKRKLSFFVSLFLNLRNRLKNLIFGCGKTYGLPYPILAAVENGGGVAGMTHYCQFEEKHFVLNYRLYQRSSFQLYWW